MAIDKMKKATVLCPVATMQRLLKTLHSLSIVELVDVFQRYDGANEKLERLNAVTDDCDVKLQKLI